MAAAMKTAVTVRIMMNTQHWDRSVEEYEFWKDNKFVFVEPVRALNWGSNSVDPKAYTYNQEQELWFENNRIQQKHIYHLPNLEFPDLNAKFYFDDDTIDPKPNIVTLINNGQTNFNGYQCEAGLKGMFIDWRGFVYLANCQIDGKIGKINEPENVRWPTAPVLCTKNLCHCASDVVFNKWI
jgi:hypothetical protein